MAHIKFVGQAWGKGLSVGGGSGPELVYKSRVQALGTGFGVVRGGVGRKNEDIRGRQVL